MIAAATIEAIRSATDLASLAREWGMNLRQAGPTGVIALCPVHQERTPSFRIHTRGERAQQFKCFGCGIHGDVVTFAALMNGYSLPRDYVRTAEYLADRAGIAIAAGSRPGPAAIKVEAENREMLDWFWLRHWNALRTSLDEELQLLEAGHPQADAEFAISTGRMLGTIEKMPFTERLSHVRALVTEQDRIDWRQHKTGEQQFANAWMSLATVGANATAR